MKNLKTISLFRICFLLVLNIYFNNIYIFIISLICLLINNKETISIFLIIAIICFINNFLLSDYIRYGIVEDITSNTVIVDKFLYKTKVYTNDNLKIGDFVYFKNQSKKISDINDLKYNYRFSYDKDVDVCFNIITRYKAVQRLNSFNDETNGYLNKILLNKNVTLIDLDYVGYGFALYYFLSILKKRDLRLSVVTLLIYLLFFEFNIKLYLIIIDYFLDLLKRKGLDRLCIKIIFITIINPYLLINNSFLISIIFISLYSSTFKNNRYVISIIQSLLFNEIKIISSFFYRYVIYLKIYILMFSFILMIIPGLENIYLEIIHIYSFISKTIDFGIRGQISIISLILIFIISKIFKINNQVYKLATLCLFLLLPINNPLSHITFIDVGQGDASLIKDSLNLTNILIDTGSKYNYSKLKKYLYKEGIYQLDYLIISHLDEDHSGNIDNIQKDFIVKEIVYKGKDIKTNNYLLEYYNLGTFDNDNDNSLVYLVKSNNMDILFTGDISSNVENILINRYALSNIDILKVSHHGSNSASSNYFIGNLKPKIATISTNGKYNHPSNEVINTLSSYLVKTYITKISGNISLYLFKNYNLLITDINEFVILKKE